MPDSVSRARVTALREFRWLNGHSDVWRFAENPESFEAIVAGLATLAHSLNPTAIAGIETRGVLFGAPVARELGLGFHTLRKTDGLFAGSRHSAESAPDYRGRTYTLRSRGSFVPGDRVVLVDDWVERGSQSRAARELIETAGATFAGLVSIVDESDGSLPVSSLVTGAELPN